MFLRMLSCYLSWYLKQVLAPILFHDHDEPAAAAQRRIPVRCGPAFQPRAGQGLPQTHRRPLPRRSFTRLFADLATICANHVQPAHDMPAFTMITTPTPLPAVGLRTTRHLPPSRPDVVSTPTPPDHKTPAQHQPVTEQGTSGYRRQTHGGKTIIGTREEKLTPLVRI